MAKIVHLHCRHCGEPMKNNPWPYCQSCNLALCYRAMPILLGMLMTNQLAPHKVSAATRALTRHKQPRWVHYPHLKDIMD